MKLNPDCLRAVLLAYEELPAISTTIGLDISGFSDEEIFYHQQLLQDAGFIVVQFMASGSDPYLTYPKRLTYKGHEFLNSSRSDNNWNTVKTKMAEAGGFVIEIAQSLLIDLLKKQLLP